MTAPGSQGRRCRVRRDEPQHRARHPRREGRDDADERDEREDEAAYVPGAAAMPAPRDPALAPARAGPAATGARGHSLDRRMPRAGGDRRSAHASSSTRA